MFARGAVFRAARRAGPCACLRSRLAMRQLSAAATLPVEDEPTRTRATAAPTPSTTTPPTQHAPATEAKRVPVEERPRPSEKEAGARMRDVLRSVAQPVVVAVARAPSGFHGATLTSFASLTLEPHPLVAFSLRLPSRLADLLRPSPTSSSSAPIQLTISLLAGADQPIADALAKPGADQARIFAAPGKWDTADPPGLQDAVGRLWCEVVHSLPLRDVGGSTGGSTAPGSELFICRVVDAARGSGQDSLVHYQREYYSVSSELEPEHE